MKEAISSGSIIVYSVKLLSLDCVFSLMIGIIPVRYARAMAGAVALFLKIETKKVRYPSSSEEYFWSRIITSYSSMTNINRSPVNEKIAFMAFDRDTFSSGNAEGYIFLSSETTSLFIYSVTELSSLLVTTSFISSWITVYLLMFSSKDESFDIFKSENTSWE